MVFGARFAEGWVEGRVVGPVFLLGWLLEGQCGWERCWRLRSLGLGREKEEMNQAVSGEDRGSHLLSEGTF